MFASEFKKLISDHISPAARAAGFNCEQSKTTISFYVLSDKKTYRFSDHSRFGGSYENSEIKEKFISEFLNAFSFLPDFEIRLLSLNQAFDLALDNREKIIEQENELIDVVVDQIINKKWFEVIFQRISDKISKKTGNLIKSKQNTVEVFSILKKISSFSEIQDSERIFNGIFNGVKKGKKQNEKTK